jgi:hypothetical protein
MADRVLFIGWGAPVRGREERSIEVFNEAVGLYARMQQEGRLEKFEVVLLTPSAGLGGFMTLHGSAVQLAAVREDVDFQHNMVAAELVVEDLTVVDGYVNDGVAQQMAIYQDEVHHVAQMA